MFVSDIYSSWDPIKTFSSDPSSGPSSGPSSDPVDPSFVDAAALVVVTCCPSFCQLSIFPVFLMVLLFFASANGWTYLVLKNSLSTFTTNNCQVRQSDQSILKNEPTVQFIILLTRTRTLRKFIPNRSTRYTIEYSIEFGKTQINKKLFRPQTIFFCGHIVRQDCPCVIKVRGGPFKSSSQRTGS